MFWTYKSKTVEFKLSINNTDIPLLDVGPHLLFRYFHQFSYFSRCTLLTMLQKHLDDMFSKEFDQNPRYLMQIWAVFAGSFASHKLLRTIPEVHSEIGRLRVTGCCGWKKEGWRNSRRNDDYFRTFFIKIGWKLKIPSWNTSIGRGRPILHGPGLIGLIMLIKVKVVNSS